MTALEVLELYRRVFSHYSDKARKTTFIGDEQMGKEFFDADIDSIGQEIEKTMIELNAAHENQEFLEVMRDHRQLLQDAFSVYVTDLRQAKENFEKKFGGNLSLKNIDNELKFAEEYGRYASGQGSG